MATIELSMPAAVLVGPSGGRRMLIVCGYEFVVFRSALLVERLMRYIVSLFLILELAKVSVSSGILPAYTNISCSSGIPATADTADFKANTVVLNGIERPHSMQIDLFKRTLTLKVICCPADPGPSEAMAEMSRKGAEILM